ncbi:hypothetical protein HAX54_040263 [Datura stramonium]|uniref:Uncharacterized protein n=1 Tax=Datura stramonium TaxID=4076 RepID=A0ABS8VQR5_DATST|nr:hypothetical protein [Datura stramonium]
MRDIFNIGIDNISCIAHLSRVCCCSKDEIEMSFRDQILHSEKKYRSRRQYKHSTGANRPAHQIRPSVQQSLDRCHGLVVAEHVPQQQYCLEETLEIHVLYRRGTNSRSYACTDAPLRHEPLSQSYSPGCSPRE